METYHKIYNVYERDRDTNKLIEGVYKRECFDVLKGIEWTFSHKTDGCLHFRQTVTTELGEIPIGKIVEDKMKVKVLSYNESTKRAEYRDIVHFHKEERVRDFVCVNVSSRGKGNKTKKIVCTDNHKFYSNGKWVQAKDLEKGQTISHLCDVLGYDIEQVILGGLLGDSCIYRPSNRTRGFAFSHSIDQSEYFQYKSDLLGSLFSECKGSIGGFPGSKPNRRGNSVVNKDISSLIMENCELGGKKYVTQQWVDSIGPLGLAVWYMDDGSLSHNDSQRDRVQLATNGFSLAEVDRLAGMLRNRYGLESSVLNNKGPTISLNSDSSAKFFSIIAPYIPKGMKYKLPKEYKNYVCCLKGVELKTSQSIIDAKVVHPNRDFPSNKSKNSKYQYDLTIDGNSNYFTTGILVHNTNIRVLWDGEKIEIRGKTDRAIVHNDLLDRVPKKIERSEGGLDYLRENYPEGDLCIYGEGYGGKIQKGYMKYGNSRPQFMMFDAKVGSNYYMSRTACEELASVLGLDIAPIALRGTLSEAVDLVKGGLRVPGRKNEAEGVVGRPSVELQDEYGARIIVKIKAVDFR